jgi:hypothetical protein
VSSRWWLRHHELVEPDQRGHAATVAFHQGPPVDAVVNSRINSEAPERARGRPIAQRSADTPPRFIAESRHAHPPRVGTAAKPARHLMSVCRRHYRSISDVVG